MIQTVIKPKRPKNKKWVRLPGLPEWRALEFEGERWYYPDADINVISSVSAVRQHGTGEVFPEYHVSCSINGRARCDRNLAKIVLKDFCLDGAEEDNHVPGGIVRNFWLPVAENLIGKECDCKQTENTIVEDKGDYSWQS